MSIILPNSFISLFGIYYSLQYLSLSDATVLTFLAPLCTAVAGAVLLGEKFSLKQAAAAVISLIGVVLIARPASLFGGLDEGSPLEVLVPEVDGILTAKQFVDAPPSQRMLAICVALIGVLGATGAYTTLTAIGKRAHPLHALTSFSVQSVIATSVAMLVTKQPIVIPARAEWLAMFVMIGIFGFFAQILLTMGLQRESASRGSMAIYTQIVFATIFERVFFNVVPTILSGIGTLLIVVSAIYVAIMAEVGNNEYLAVASTFSSLAGALTPYKTPQPVSIVAIAPTLYPQMYATGTTPAFLMPGAVATQPILRPTHPPQVTQAPYHQGNSTEQSNRILARGYNPGAVGLQGNQFPSGVRYQFVPGFPGVPIGVAASQRAFSAPKQPVYPTPAIHQHDRPSPFQVRGCRTTFGISTTNPTMAHALNTRMPDLLGVSRATSWDTNFDQIYTGLFRGVSQSCQGRQEVDSGINFSYSPKDKQYKAGAGLPVSTSPRLSPSPHCNRKRKRGVNETGSRSREKNPVLIPCNIRAPNTDEERSVFNAFLTSTFESSDRKDKTAFHGVNKFRCPFEVNGKCEDSEAWDFTMPNGTTSTSGLWSHIHRVHQGKEVDPESDARFMCPLGCGKSIQHRAMENHLWSRVHCTPDSFPYKMRCTECSYIFCGNTKFLAQRGKPKAGCKHQYRRLSRNEEWSGWEERREAKRQKHC
ncbi:hypothetical protein D9611_010282 [Ephemerocybe angulata]|uniref:EamA domain-containing protein n=1 Tax=Ephemerocybe angulata TaxID=980116 RepID=A0A8H5F1H4_9AGAR|nr:hypothetical protein D9611_010282 [Tulosesus angulatus]